VACRRTPGLAGALCGRPQPPDQAVRHRPGRSLIPSCWDQSARAVAAMACRASRSRVSVGEPVEEMHRNRIARSLPCLAGAQTLATLMGIGQPARNGDRPWPGNRPVRLRPADPTGTPRHGLRSGAKRWNLPQWPAFRHDAPRPYDGHCPCWPAGATARAYSPPDSQR